MLLGEKKEKKLEGLILQRLDMHMEGENGMSDRQHGFRKERSTINAVQEVVNRAETAKNGINGKKVLCIVGTPSIQQDGMTQWQHYRRRRFLII